MTTIIVKNADFSAGRIAHYSPPVAGASLCAFVGDSDPDTWLRNFGSGPDLAAVGSPASVDDAFRLFDLGNYLQTDVLYTQNITLMAVARSIFPGAPTTHANVLSSERTHTVGRRGVALNKHDNNIARSKVTAFGGMTGGTHNSLSATDPVTVEAPSFFCGTVTPHSGGTGVTVGHHGFTGGSARSVYGHSTVDNSNRPEVNEAQFPIRVGKGYLEVVAIGAVQVGFVAIYPRVLTAPEMAAMYASVKKRFASLGVTI